MKLRDESGQILVIAAGAFATLLVMAAFALDTSGWFQDTSRLQTGADAAAISGATFYAEGDNSVGGPCVGIGAGMMLTPEERGVACAKHVAGLNKIPLADGYPKIVTGYDGADGIEVDALNPDPPNYLAGSLLGISPKTHAETVATILGVTAEANTPPVGVADTVANTWSVGSTQTLDFDKDGTEVGNYFTEFKNYKGCRKGVRGLRRCIQDGCGNGCVYTVGEQTGGPNGNNWMNVYNGWNARGIGTTFAIVVYDPTSNTTVEGFAEVTIIALATSGTITVRFDSDVQAPSSGTSVTGGPFFGVGSVYITK